MRIEIPKNITDKKEIFSYLHKQKLELIAMKMMAIKFTDNFGVTEKELTEFKALNTSNVDDVASGVIKRTIIGNTYYWMDSHDDVHIEGIFSKSISERALNKIFHLADHEFKTSAKIGKFTKVYEKAVQWNNLGVNKFGYTSALFADSDIREDYNRSAFKAYLNGEMDQHSVGMQYVDLALAINDPEYKEEYAEWVKHIDKIGNRDKAEIKGYFWAVKEAKLREISSVLEGSNELTPTLNNKIGPVATTQKEGPEASTQIETAKKEASFYF